MVKDSIFVRRRSPFAANAIVWASMISLATIGMAGCSGGIARTEAKALLPAVEYVGPGV